MSTDNNPAGRFYRLLSQAKGNQKNRNVNAFKVWAELLEADEKKPWLVLRSLAGVMELPAIIREQIRGVPEIDQSLYLKWVPKVELAFASQRLNGHFHDFIQHIDDATLHGLEFCAECLSRKCPERRANESQLKEIAKDVAELIEEVLASDLPEDLRKFLLEHLNDLNRALQEYRLFGFKPLERAYGAIISGGLVAPEIIEKAKSKPHGQKFWAVFKKLSVVLMVAKSFVELGDRSFRVLGDARNIIEHLVPSQAVTSSHPQEETPVPPENESEEN